MALALFPHCKRRETEEGPSRLRERERKKHTRPVMQKHRFNVRLGSVISSGERERKKLVWSGRKRETEAKQTESHQAGL